MEKMNNMIPVKWSPVVNQIRMKFIATVPVKANLTKTAAFTARYQNKGRIGRQIRVKRSLPKASLLLWNPISPKMRMGLFRPKGMKSQMRMNIMVRLRTKVKMKDNAVSIFRN